MGSTAQAAQRVIDLERETAYERSARQVLRGQILFAHDAAVTVVALQLHELRRVLMRLLHRRDGAVERDGAAARQDQAEFAFGERVSGVQRAAAVGASA